MKEVLSFKILKMPHLNYVFAQNTYHVNRELSLIVFEDFTPYWLTLDYVINSPSTFLISEILHPFLVYSSLLVYQRANRKN